MSWSLRESPDAVAAAAAQVEEVTGIPMAHIEKDFWVTEVLRGVASCRRDPTLSFCRVTSKGAHVVVAPQ